MGIKGEVYTKNIKQLWNNKNNLSKQKQANTFYKNF